MPEKNRIKLISPFFFIMSLVSYYKHWTSFLYLTLRYPTIRIYTKTPSIIAGNELSGTIVIEYPSNLFGITVTMIGKEGIQACVV